MGGRAKNLVFPPARIKRMMRSDREVGKIAVSAPFLVSKALQLALEDFLTTAADLARQRKVSVITPHQLRLCVENEKRFRSLKRVVEHVPLQPGGQEEETSKPPKRRKTSKKEKEEEFVEKVKKNKVSMRRRVVERNGGKRRKSTTKQSETATSQQTESIAVEKPSDTEQVENKASENKPKSKKAVPDAAPSDNLKVSLQSTTDEDNYDEE